MNLPLNVDVQCTDGPAARSTTIVFNPDTGQVTYLVVELKEGLDNQVMAPLNLIAQSTPKEIRLNCSKDELAQCQPFIKVVYLGEGDPDEAYRELGASNWSAYRQDSLDAEMLEVYSALFAQVEQVPEGELAIPYNAKVEATDGTVGTVDELIIDAASNTLTHLVLREGHLWRQREISIPVTQIDHVEAGTVYLKLDKASAEALPKVSTDRG